MEAVIDVAEVMSRFQALTSLVPLQVIRDAQDYDRAVSALNQLLDAGAAHEGHALAPLAVALGALIGDYDDEHHPAELVSPAAMLRFLMEQRQLTQSEVPEVGSQGVVSEVLCGKRPLNVRQIKALAARFNVPASVFL